MCVTSSSALIIESYGCLLFLQDLQSVIVCSDLWFLSLSLYNSGLFLSKNSGTKVYFVLVNSNISVLGMLQMVPLFNISFSGVAFSLHGRSDYSNSTVSFSLAARSYNDKYESWEPIIEPMDGFLR